MRPVDALIVNPPGSDGETVYDGVPVKLLAVNTAVEAIAEFTVPVTV
jgi:hypothetical protein